MREFSIILDGTRLDLNGRQGLYFVNPKGLGTESVNQIVSIHDNGFFLNTHSAVKGGTITGDLLIVSGYTGYKTFVDALMTAEEIVIAYKPNGTEYLCRVALNFVTKTELGVRGAIVVPLSLAKISPWYRELTILGNSSFVNVSAGGQIGTSFVIGAKASYALNNPVFTVTDADGNELQRLEFTVNIQANKLVEWSTHYHDSHITVDGVDAISNVVITSNLFDHTRKAFKINFPTAMNYSGNVRYWWRTV